MIATLLLSISLLAESPAQPPLPHPQPELLPAPSPPGAIPASPLPFLPVKVPTYDQFVSTFVPIPGIHEVTVIHPVSRKPVNFVFRLPDLPLKKVHSGGTRITYDYGKTEVTLIFRIISGKVDVRYD